MNFEVGDRVRLLRQISKDFIIDRRQRGTIVGFGCYLDRVVFVCFDRISYHGRVMPESKCLPQRVLADDLKLWQ